MNKRIKRRREQLKLSQRELARTCKVDVVTWWRYEQGQLKPSADAIVRIARALDVTTDWLLTGKRPAPAAAR
jgi:transcriptional regulator with XRE-family HTH domain